MARHASVSAMGKKKLAVVAVLGAAMTLTGCASAYNDENSTEQMIAVIAKLPDGAVQSEPCEGAQSKRGDKVTVFDVATGDEVGEGHIANGFVTPRGEFEHMGMVCEQIVRIQVLNEFVQADTDDYTVVVNGVELRLVPYGSLGFGGYLFAE